MLLESVANDLAIRIDGAWRSGEICARVEGSVVPTEPEFVPGQSRVGPSTLSLPRWVWEAAESQTRVIIAISASEGVAKGHGERTQ